MFHHPTHSSAILPLQCGPGLNSYLQQCHEVNLEPHCNTLSNVLPVSRHVCQCVMYDKRFAGGYFSDVDQSCKMSQIWHLYLCNEIGMFGVKGVGKPHSFVKWSRFWGKFYHILWLNHLYLTENIALFPQELPLREAIPNKKSRFYGHFPYGGGGSTPFHSFWGCFN